MTVTARAEGEETETVEVRPVSLNIQYRHEDGKYERIAGAIVKAKNNATGDEYTFEMGADASVAKNELPLGAYTFSIVSLPDEFTKGKNLDFSHTIVEEVKKGRFNQSLTFTVKDKPLFDVSLNTQLEGLDGSYTNIPNAVSKAVNTETGVEYIFTMDEKGNIPHEQLPEGTYKVSIVSVPDDFAKDKNLDTSETYEKTVTSPDSGKGWTIRVKELPADEETPEPGEETKKVNFGSRLAFRNLPGKEYESLEKANTPYKFVNGAKIKITNAETGKEYTFTTDKTGSHQKVEVGKYTIELVDVPKELKGRFEWPKSREIEINTSSSQGFNVVEIIPTVDVSLNTQYMDLDRKFSRIPNGVSKAVNTETGETFIFTMDEKGNIPHLRLPEGTYELSLVSLPDEFKEGKKLDTSFTDTVTIKEPFKNKGWKVTVKELPADEEPENPGEEKVTVDVSLNTQYMDLDRNFSRIPNAVSKAVNTETGEEYIFTMDAEGNIPHLQLPAGTYKLSLVSLPEEFTEGKKLDTSFTDTVTIKEPYRNQGWKVTVKELPADEEPENPGEEKVTVDVSLNTQYMDLDRNFSRIPNAVSKAVNTETGEEYIFTMDAEGNIPHLQLPAGTYQLSIVSVPEDFSEGKKLDLSATSTEVVLETDKAHGWTLTVKELPADEEPEVKKYQIGLEVRDLENKKTKVTVEVLDKDGKVVKGNFNEVLQYLTEDLDLGTYTIKLSNLPENTKAVINENTYNKAKETENKNEFTLEVSKENLITASSNRVWGAFKLVEETSTDEEPETPEPKLIKLTFDPNGGTWSDDSTSNKYVEAKKGDEITILEAPTREGYKFLYWEGSVYQPGDKYTAEADHTFVAKWEKIETPTPGEGDDDQTPAPGTGDDQTPGDDNQTPAPGTGDDDNTGTNPTPEKSKTPEVNKVTEGDKKITGKGEPESDIVVELPDGTRLEGKVDKDGNWTVEIPDDKTLKTNDRIKVTQTEKGKTVSNTIEIVVSKKSDQKVDEKETEKPGKDGKTAPKTGDAGVMLTSAVTLLSSAAYVFTKKRKED